MAVLCSSMCVRAGPATQPVNRFSLHSVTGPHCIIEHLVAAGLYLVPKDAPIYSPLEGSTSVGVCENSPIASRWAFDGACRLF